MTSAAQRKSELRSELKKTLTDTKPLYVAAGVGDLAVGQLRKLPGLLAGLRPDRKDIEARLGELQTETLALPARAQATAVEVLERADAAYDDLAARGKGLVRRIRRQRTSQELGQQARTAVRRTKAAAAVAKESTDDTTRSAKGTATTARKRAAATRGATTTASRSVHKTAAKAVDAARDGAGKVG